MFLTLLWLVKCALLIHALNILKCSVCTYLYNVTDFDKHTFIIQYSFVVWAINVCWQQQEETFLDLHLYSDHLFILSIVCFSFI